jgi:hypothetical protein
MSLHLHQVPQAAMLECKLEILILVFYSKWKPARLNMQAQRGQYNDVLANDTYLVAVVRSLSTWYLASGSHRLICIKPVLSYNSFTKPSFKVLFFSKGRNNPNYHILARHVAPGETQQSWNLTNHHPSECMVLSSYLGVSRQILVIQKWWWDSFVHSMSRDSIVHNRGHG